MIGQFSVWGSLISTKKANLSQELMLEISEGNPNVAGIVSGLTFTGRPQGDFKNVGSASALGV